MDKIWCRHCEVRNLSQRTSELAAELKSLETAESLQMWRGVVKERMADIQPSGNSDRFV